VHPLKAQQSKLSDQLVTLWANFARTGNPNGEGDTQWPQYNVAPGQTGYYLVENIPALSTMTDAQFSAAHKCDFWDPII
jgi:para-nitrobenzyl esterase